MATLPVKPRDAASLVLIDYRDGEPHVLMGKRHARMKFVPDAYVFPGGKLDPEDHLPTPASRLSERTAAHLRRSASINQAQALAMAAIRETFEETGLLVAAPGDIGAAPGQSWNRFRELGLAPRLDILGIMARAITPTNSPMRFHARFFVGPAAAASGTISGSGELSDLDWYPVSHALRLPLIDVTEFILKEVQAGKGVEPESGEIPLYCYLNGRPRVIRR